MEIVKELVSKKKKRFKFDGYNLDLSYIKPNIVAMGFPAEKFEGCYRNNIEDVHKFFEEKHSNHYKIYNLCKERKYDTTKFPLVAHFPFEDHNAPPFQLIKPFCEDVADYLGQHEQNVAVIHCKAGKGRTGVMIVSYLLHEKIFDNVRQALAFYGEARTHNMKGVTIPSQRRYVYYYGDLIRRNLKFESSTLLLTKLKLVKMPYIQSGSLSVTFSVSIGYVKMYSSPYYEARRDLEYKDLYLKKAVPVCGDIRIEVFTKHLTKERLCIFWLNTFFIAQRTRTGEEDDCVIGGADENSFVVTLSKLELDKLNKDGKHKIAPKDFKLEVHFSRCLDIPLAEEGMQLNEDTDPEEDVDLDDIEDDDDTPFCSMTNLSTNDFTGSENNNGNTSHQARLSRNSSSSINQTRPRVGNYNSQV